MWRLKAAAGHDLRKMFGFTTTARHPPPQHPLPARPSEAPVAVTDPRS